MDFLGSSSSDEALGWFWAAIMGGNGGKLKTGLFSASLGSLGVSRGETSPRLVGGVVEAGVPSGMGVGVLAKEVMAAAAAVGPKRPYPDGDVR